SGETALQLLTSNLSDPTLSHALDQALTSAAAVCAYSKFYIPALQKATESLADNHLYFFNLFPSTSVAHLGESSHWEKTQCSVQGENCYIPKQGEIHEALQSLYGNIFSSECASGLQLAEYATINELFGAKEVERSFRPQEIFVGDWIALNHSSGVVQTTDGSKLRT